VIDETSLIDEAKRGDLDAFGSWGREIRQLMQRKRLSFPHFDTSNDFEVDLFDRGSYALSPMPAMMNCAGESEDHPPLWAKTIHLFGSLD
jgi:hypothetical protein